MSKTEARRVMRDLAKGEKIRKHLGACIEQILEMDDDEDEREFSRRDSCYRRSLWDSNT